MPGRDHRDLGGLLGHEGRKDRLKRLGVDYVGSEGDLTQLRGGAGAVEGPAQGCSRRQPGSPDLDAVHDLVGGESPLGPGSDDGDATPSFHQPAAKVVDVAFQSAYFRREVDAMHGHVHGPSQSDVERAEPVSAETTMSAMRSPALPSP